MRPKKYQKKLELNKETVSNLCIKELENARGGADALPTYWLPYTDNYCTITVCTIPEICLGTMGLACTAGCYFD